MKRTPSTWLILRNDHWCFLPALLLGMVAVLMPLGALAGYRRLTFWGDWVPALAVGGLVLGLVIFRVLRIRDVLENGRAVEAVVLSSIGSSCYHHLRVRFLWEGDARVKRWVLIGWVKQQEERIELRVDPENPRRVYPVPPFCRDEG